MQVGVRQQRQEACALDRNPQLALVARLGARDAGGDDSAVFVDEILQQADVFVINQLDAFSRKAAELATTKQGIALFAAVLAFAFAEFTFTATSANACHVRFLF